MNNEYDTSGPYSHGNPKHVEIEELDNITPADFGWTPEAIKAYMYGIKVMDPNSGQEMGDKFYNHVLETAISRAENALDVAILPRLVEDEHHDFHSSDYNSYMFTETFRKPIVQAERLKLEMTGFSLFDYPADWWKVYNLAGHIELFPTALMQATGAMGGGAIYQSASMPIMNPMMGMGARTTAPQLIHVDYVAGMLPRKHQYAQEWECPADLEQLVIKIALKEIYQVWGNLIIGAGIAGKTLSVDGISESIQTTQTAMYGGASAQIVQINEDIENLMSGLKAYYGMNLGII